MNENNDMSAARHALVRITALANDYCVAVQSAAGSERRDFVASMLRYLPTIYVSFIELTPDMVGVISDPSEAGAYFPEYVDEDYYESVRRHLETLMGEQDTFLETFEEDMKYSDTPIAASVSESLADIFQPLYNFVETVRESGSESIAEAYALCRETFESYWAQTLCNVLRALNNIYFENRIP